MIYGLYHSAAGMLVNQYRQDVIANNLANVETVGYKRDAASFSERLIEARSRLSATRHPLLDEMTGGVWSVPTHTDWQPGSVDVTGNGLDVAILGDGFFAVQTPDGVRYTRAGQFTIDPQGRLVSQQGDPVLGASGAPIQVPAGAGSIRIGTDGRILADGQGVAQLRVVKFDDPAALRKVGRNLVAGEGEPQVIPANLRPGAVERSNVYAMSEMAAMIEASRAYQLNAQFVSLQDSTLGRLINEVARPVA